MTTFTTTTVTISYNLSTYMWEYIWEIKKDEDGVYTHKERTAARQLLRALEGRYPNKQAVQVKVTPAMRGLFADDGCEVLRAIVGLALWCDTSFVSEVLQDVAMLRRKLNLTTNDTRETQCA